jgi:hypothetical protein
LNFNLAVEDNLKGSIDEYEVTFPGYTEHFKYIREGYPDPNINSDKSKRIYELYKEKKQPAWEYSFVTISNNGNEADDKDSILILSIVLSEDFFSRSAPFRIEMGNGIVDWTISLSTHGANNVDAVRFLASSPKEGIIDIERLTLKKEHNRQQIRQFDGTLSAIFVDDLRKKTPGGSERIVRVTGAFEVTWKTKLLYYP